MNENFITTCSVFRDGDIVEVLDPNNHIYVTGCIRICDDIVYLCSNCDYYTGIKVPDGNLYGYQFSWYLGRKSNSNRISILYMRFKDPKQNINNNLILFNYYKFLI